MVPLLGKWICFSLVGLTLVFSCSKQPERYEIQKVSPNGEYRVSVDVLRRKPPGSLDEATFEFFQRDDLLASWHWKQEDAWEPSFDAFTPMDWIDENVFHIGGGNRNSAFRDEVIVQNQSGEDLKYVSVTYDRTDLYDILNLTAGSQVKIHPHPWFTAKGDEFSFSCSGVSRSGRKFIRIIKSPERLNQSSGPRNFQILIGKEDFK